MEQFYKDALRFGCLNGGFRHFGLYLRGREELLVLVRCGAAAGHGAARPGAHPSFVRTGQALPPASPAGRDVIQGDSQDLVYLIGAYARYNWPYVWLRSPGGSVSATEKDLPLDLRTTADWSKGWHVWHIVEELLALNLSPAPLNPFEVDLAAVTALPAMQRLLMTAALAGFLRELLLGNPAYADKGAPCLQRDALPPPPPGLCRAARGSIAAHHGVTQEAAGAAAVHVDLRKLLQLHFADASRCLTAEPTAPAEAAGGGGGGGSGGGLQQYQQYQQGAAYAAAVYGAR